LAKEQGVHPSTVARIWQEHELKPHRQKSFKLVSGQSKPATKGRN